MNPPLGFSSWWQFILWILPLAIAFILFLTTIIPARFWDKPSKKE